MFWLTAAILLEMFTNFSGIILAGWNILDAFQAKARNDRNTLWCFVFAIGGFLLVLVWTILRYRTT